jgi:hypothetical protein
MKPLLMLVMLAFLAGCQQLPTKPVSIAVAKPIKLKKQYSNVLLEAENKASPPARKVLATGREMALVTGDVIAGSCWDYANAVFDRAGFPRKGKRETILNGKKGEPLSISFNAIQPGDFLSYINHSYNDIEHSAIFVDWLDFDKKIGLMLSYAGQKRSEPARYKPYDLSDVYYIARARG